MTSSAPPRNRSRRGPTRSDTPAVADAHQADAEYKVGPGRPPKEFQFKPGQSGNPTGAKQKSPSIAPDLKALLERALSKTLKLGNAEKERIVSKAAAGIENLVNQFASGDRHARRDLIVLAGKLGVDLTAGHSIENAIADVLSAEDQAILDDYVRRHGGGRDDHGGDHRDGRQDCAGDNVVSLHDEEREAS
jgi:hypothetical protein